MTLEVGTKVVFARIWASSRNHNYSGYGARIGKTATIAELLAPTSVWSVRIKWDDGALEAWADWCFKEGGLFDVVEEFDWSELELQ